MLHYPADPVSLGQANRLPCWNTTSWQAQQQDAAQTKLAGEHEQALPCWRYVRLYVTCQNQRLQKAGSCQCEVTLFGEVQCATCLSLYQTCDLIRNIPLIPDTSPKAQGNHTFPCTTSSWQLLCSSTDTAEACHAQHQCFSQCTQC